MLRDFKEFWQALGIIVAKLHSKIFTKSESAQRTPEDFTKNFPNSRLKHQSTPPLAVEFEDMRALSFYKLCSQGRRRGFLQAIEEEKWLDELDNLEACHARISQREIEPQIGRANYDDKIRFAEIVCDLLTWQKYKLLNAGEEIRRWREKLVNQAYSYVENVYHNTNGSPKILALRTAVELSELSGMNGKAQIPSSLQKEIASESYFKRCLLASRDWRQFALLNENCKKSQDMNRDPLPAQH